MEPRALTLELLTGATPSSGWTPEPLPAWASGGPFVSVTRTDAERRSFCPQAAGAGRRAGRARLALPPGPGTLGFG